MSSPNSADVQAAAARIGRWVTRTPVLHSEALDHALGSFTAAKAESLQQTGSFKLRGALNKVLTLTTEQCQAGLITVSAGNAALGVAQAARMVGAPATVVMPVSAVAEKVTAVRALGATVVQDGVVDAAAAFARAEQVREATGATFVHPFDDPEVVAGAATATRELLDECPNLERILLPCSGGGLLAGAVVAACGEVEVVGVQPEGAASWLASLRAGCPTRTPAVTMADGLTAPQPGQLNFEIVRDAGVRVVTVPERSIAAAMRTIVQALRVVVEPSAAVTVAAMLTGAVVPGPRTGVVLSGSNVSRALLVAVLGDGEPEGLEVSA